MSGVLGMGVGQRRTALSGLRRSANLEDARENAEASLEAQQESMQKSMAGTGAGMGAGIAALAGAGPVGIVAGGILGLGFGWGLGS